MPFSSLERAIFTWDTNPRRLHCSNCRFARVKGTEEAPIAFCTAGHGEMPLEHLLRKYAHGWKPAEHCDDFMYAEWEGTKTCN